MAGFEPLLLAWYGTLLGNTPQLVETVTVGSPTPSVPLTIPNAYNRLLVVWYARATTAVTALPMNLQINGTTASDYLWQVNQANNTTVAGTDSGGAVGQIQVGTIPAASATALYFGSGSFIIDGANQTTNYPTVQGTGCGFTSTTNSYSGTYSGQYNVAGAAVSSLLLFPASSANFVSGCRFSVSGLQ